MTYYVAKGIQALGLITILISFIKNFPQLMDPKIFALGILIFFSGWLIEKFILQK